MNLDGVLEGFACTVAGIIVGVVLLDTLYVRRDWREAMYMRKITELAEANQQQAQHVKRLQAHVRELDAYIADHSEPDEPVAADGDDVVLDMDVWGDL